VAQGGGAGGGGKGGGGGGGVGGIGVKKVNYGKFMENYGVMVTC